jgi:hypothetical protein
MHLFMYPLLCIYYALAFNKHSHRKKTTVLGCCIVLRTWTYLLTGGRRKLDNEELHFVLITK